MTDYELLFKQGIKAGINYDDFWWKLSLYEIKLMYEAYSEKQKDYFTLLAYSVANGVNNVLNGTPINMFKNNNEQIINENNEVTYIDKEEKENELNDLKTEFFK